MCLCARSVSLSQHSDSDAPALDRKERAEWWEQRQGLDDDLAELLVDLEKHLGSATSLLVPAGGGVSHGAAPTAEGGGYSADDLTKLKVADLKARLADRGLPTAGLKKDLVQRLVEAAGPPTRAGAAAGEAAPGPTRNAPVILILDEQLQRLPWEGMGVLRTTPVSRAPSLGLILAHGVGWLPGACSAEVRVRRGHYVLDPEGNLPRTRATLQPTLEELGRTLCWKGAVGKAPSEESFR